MKTNRPIAAVDILLSTYNGDLYLRALLDSVLGQTFSDWKLIIRDDGSEDSTCDILQSYCTLFPDKITFMHHGEKTHLGACQSFAQLLESSTSDYIMFCDQDDVWLPTKIADTVNKICELEAKYGNTPILVHTDLKVVDKDLNVLSDSFWKFQNINPDFKKINNLLIMNNVTGCTMMINRELKMLSMPIPKSSIMHDWWIALVASVFGVTGYIDSATILYRQHDNNDTGAMRYRYSVRHLMSWFRSIDVAVAFTRRKISQSQAFYHSFRDRFTRDQSKVIYSFSTLLQKGRLKRIYDMIDGRFFGYGYLRNLGLLLLWFSIKNTNSAIAPNKYGHKHPA